uniref:Uncharacterized protein n=1 Tax=Meloidogyne enterolobii TaxID=390850 RepID=A0A6V7YCC5_MELEN|nr:unnamed protein product [Meloidogyne enterolobii]
MPDFINLNFTLNAIAIMPFKENRFRLPINLKFLYNIYEHYWIL